MLTTVAALVVVLGLMVSLARDVRNRSADRVTKDLLVRLERLVQQYQARHGGGVPVAAAFPPAEPLPDDPADAEAALRAAATRNGSDVARALRGALQTVGAHVPQMPALIRPATPATAPSPERGTDAEADEGAPPPEAPAVTLDAAPFFDAWGSPVVFLPRQHPKIGMSAGDRPFFVSPGPDRRYLTREDNLYSYEEDLE